MGGHDLSTVLDECKKSAKAGYKIASGQEKNLNKVLSVAKEKVRSALYDFSNSPCYSPEATSLLEGQLSDIEQAFLNLSFAFQEDLENLRSNMSKFSITLFGRTMAGKSTLMEILTEGNGETIGKGAQRTTRDIRKYTWNELEITDVPGIGAFEGEDDEQIAFEAAKTADLILFLITDDAPQVTEADCFSRIIDLGKPVICVMNVKASVAEGKSIKLVKRDIQKRFDMERLGVIRNQFLKYADQFGQTWLHVPFILINTGSGFQKAGQAVLNNAYKAGAQGGLKLTNFSGSTIHQMVLNVGRSIGYKFKPWQAIKITRGIAIGGQVLSVLGVGLTVFMQIKADQDEQRIREDLKSNRQNIRSQFNVVANELEDFARQYVKDNVIRPLEVSISTIDRNIQEIRDSRHNRSILCRNMEELQQECRFLIQDIHSTNLEQEER